VETSYTEPFKVSYNLLSCTDLKKILHAHPHLSIEGFGAVLTQAPSTPWAWGAETLKAEGHIFENVYRTKDVQQVGN